MSLTRHSRTDPPVSRPMMATSSECRRSPRIVTEIFRTVCHPALDPKVARPVAISLSRSSKTSTSATATVRPARRTRATALRPEPMAGREVVGAEVDWSARGGPARACTHSTPRCRSGWRWGRRASGRNPAMRSISGRMGILRTRRPAGLSAASTWKPQNAQNGAESRLAWIFSPVSKSAISVCSPTA